MKTITQHIRDKLHGRVGVLGAKLPNLNGATIDSLRRSEWSDEFEAHMRDRLVMGALRYGPLRQPNKKQYDRVGSMQKRLKKYIDNGNTEFLVDVANLALVEFVEGDHPKKHFKAIDDGEHTEEKRK